METLESSRVCRLCGKQSGISINIFDKNESHVRKINAVLPIMVHEMDLLPKHMCHRCSYKLEEFHKFYVDCLKTDADLKSQLSWMGKEVPKERVGIPMVHIENIKIKIEPPDYDAYDMNPMVDNVDYINSMGSVTFQPDDIPYAAYARCRCCCDKMDQSNNRAVPTNYENTISRCNRVGDVEAGDNDRANRSQAVKKRPVASETCQERSNAAMCVNETHSRSSRPASSSFDHAGGARVKVGAKNDVSGSTIVRNLRPRKGSVDYVGVKKKSLPVSTISKSRKSKASTLQPLFDATTIKVEALDDFEGRILRPRRGTIDYCASKRKYSKSTDKNQRSQGEEYRVAKHKVRNIASRLKLPSRKVSRLAKDRIKFIVKEEELSDHDDTVVDESLSSATLLKIRKADRTCDVADKIDALPNGLLVNGPNDRVNCDMLNCVQPTKNFSVVNGLKSPRALSKGKLKSEKMGLNRIAAIAYSPKLLRSHEAYLRNGKVKKLNSVEASATKLRKNLQNIADRGRTTGSNLMSIKLIDNIKRYCEVCNISFPNKELLKLHACYH